MCYQLIFKTFVTKLYSYYEIGIGWKGYIPANILMNVPVRCVKCIPFSSASKILAPKKGRTKSPKF